MLWYVAIVAVVNLGLGYALAVYLGAGRTPLATVVGESLDGAENFDAADA